jgi:exodeoxyribonuclease VII large subunit
MDFFEFHKQVTQRPRPAKPVGKSGEQRPPMSVLQLTTLIDKVLRDHLPATVHVKGEVSNFKLHNSSGHAYFTLKDPGACVDCVIYKSDVERLAFRPEDGLEVVASGRIKIYAEKGRYQLYVSEVEPIGQGALELAFRQLCKKLDREGLFAPERKRPIPPYPRRIALVTSTQTAAIADMLKILRRYPWLKIACYHVPVQGDGAGARIAEAIDDLSAMGSADVILLGRGGGSLEDLWAFNEEAVARAVAGCAIPVVTGIGHEIDVSIADLAADYHAHTPTEAARVVTASWKDAGDVLDELAMRLRREAKGRWDEARRWLSEVERHEMFRRPLDKVNLLRQKLDDRQRGLALALGSRLGGLRGRLAAILARAGARHPRNQLALSRERLEGRTKELERLMSAGMGKRRQMLDAMAAHLRAVGPEQVLNRGYSITRVKKTGEVVRSAEQIKAGERLSTRVADGEIESVAQDGKQMSLFE